MQLMSKRPLKTPKSNVKSCKKIGLGVAGETERSLLSGKVNGSRASSKKTLIAERVDAKSRRSSISKIARNRSDKISIVSIEKMANGSAFQTLKK